MKKKGIELSKRELQKLLKQMKHLDFNPEVMLRTQVIGNSIIRVIGKQDDAIFISIDKDYYLYNLKNSKAVKYNVSEKNIVNTQEDINWKDVV